MGVNEAAWRKKGDRQGGSSLESSGIQSPAFQSNNISLVLLTLIATCLYFPGIMKAATSGLPGIFR